VVAATWQRELKCGVSMSAFINVKFAEGDHAEERSRRVGMRLWDARFIWGKCGAEMIASRLERRCLQNEQKLLDEKYSRDEKTKEEKIATRRCIAA
jgi:hypothetical protein